MTDHLLRVWPRTGACEGTHVVIRGGEIAAKSVNSLHLSGEYVIGASSVRRVHGLDGVLVIHASLRSWDGTVWEGRQCIIGKEACPLRGYGARAVPLVRGEYALDVEIDESPPDLEAEVCVAPAPIKGGLLVTGARSGERLVMRPAPGSTRSRSLMVAEPVRVGKACVQRLWLWFFEPGATRPRPIVAKLEGGEGVVYSISTELMRVGIYSEVVVDALIPPGGGRVVFLDPANLTRPLFTTHAEGCGSAD